MPITGGLMEAPLINTGLGLLLEGHNDRRQYFQQKRLQGLEIRGSKELMDYESMHAQNLWEKTNYPAQFEQLRKAGGSIGLMYGKGGQGGQIMKPSGNVTGATAQQNPGDMMQIQQLGLMARMQEAQIENIEANTEKTKVDTAKTAGVDTQEAQGRIAKIAAETTNEQLKADLLEYQKTVDKIRADYAGENAQQLLEQLKTANAKLVEELNQAKTDTYIKDETKFTAVRQVMLETIEKATEIELKRSNIIGTNASTEETYAKINRVSAEIIRMQEQTDQGREALKQGQIKLSQEQQQILLEKMRTEFGSGDTAELARIMQVLTMVTNSAAKVAGHGE